MILIVPAILTAAVLWALYYGYKLAFYYRDPHEPPLGYVRDELTKELEPRFDKAITEFVDAPFEQVSIRSRDGLILTGQYYHLADGAPLYIQCHGYKGNPFRDFAGTWPVARELGHNVLLINERCHGSSEGRTITFGIREHEDCLRWVEYAVQRFGPVPMLLMGVSMGAATVLMASDRDLPENVKGIVADCPYDAPDGIIKKVLGVEMGMPVKLVYPLIRLGGILYGKFDLESHSPLKAVPNAKVPILLIHGDADAFVPYNMSCRLHAAAPEKIRFHTIPGAGHALNQVKDPQLYRSILVPFIKKYLV